MHRFPLIISFLSAAFALVAIPLSCTKGSDGRTEDGLAFLETRFPSGNTFSRGDDVIVLGSGFSSQDTFILVDTSGNETVLGNVTVTPSGFFFTADFPAGEYTLAVESAGVRREIGPLTITVPSINVTVSQFDPWCIPGSTFSVRGLGFDSGTALAVETPDGSRTVLETDFSSGTLTATVPESGTPRGRLSLLVIQGEGEAIVTDSFFITSRKWLCGVTYTIGAGMTSYEHSYSLHVTRSGVPGGTGQDGADGEVTGFTEYIMTTSEGNDATHGNYTQITLTPTSEDSGYNGMVLKIRDSRVLSCTFETTQGGVSGNYEFNWSYDSGYLSYAVGSGTSYSTVFLDASEGKRVFDQMYISVLWGDSPKVNNPFAVDFTLDVLATDNEAIRVAQIMGLTGTGTSYLPESLDGRAVSYTFDSEGYLTKAAYTDPYTQFPIEIEYTYFAKNL